VSTETADLLTATLAREIASSGVRMFAVTSPAAVAAARAARELGAPELALIVGFSVIDGSPVPSVSLGEAGLLTGGPTFRDEPGDVFVGLARGRVGVAATPAQLDASGRTNLSGIGEPGNPKVALPGARGLPDHRSTSRVWYLFASHGPRQLVERVDVVCGAVPPPGALRRLITPAGCFELAAGGWKALWLTTGGAELVASAPGLGVVLSGEEPVIDAPDEEALAALQLADPHGVRHIEFAEGPEATRLWRAAAEREAA
jgi:acyl CoA:acetate/3-ketoacid CoA transferase beta subunit